MPGESLKDFILTNQKYQRGLVIDTYDGYSIASAALGKDGNIYKEWAFPQGPGNAPKEKAVPIKIYLGKTPDEAIQVLRNIAELLKNAKKQEDDIPY